ncbi:MAG TPA: flagellar filament capping protein FliD, partial [bacterium]|nr:flagellar filament capping protein FliD [bacterium]
SDGGLLLSTLGLPSGTVSGPVAESAAGLARRLEAGLKDYTGLDGFLQSQVTAGGLLDDRLAELGEQLADAEERLAQFEARTRQQFVALEKAMASFQSTRQFLDQRFAQLSASTQR